MRAADVLSFDSNSSQLSSGRKPTEDPVGSDSAAAAATKDVGELLAHDAIAVSRRRQRRAARG